MNVEKTFKLNDLKYGGSLTALRLEGSKKSVNERMNNLKEELNVANLQISLLEDYQSEIFWNKVVKTWFIPTTVFLYFGVDWIDLVPFLSLNTFTFC